jgi:hypothetical protein
LSQHNIIGSEAFDTHRVVQIRRYPRRGATWRTYVIAAMVGGGCIFAAAAGMLYLANNFSIG